MAREDIYKVARALLRARRRAQRKPPTNKIKTRLLLADRTGDIIDDLRPKATPSISTHRSGFLLLLAVYKLLGLYIHVNKPR